MNRRIVFFDFEGTGVDPYNDRIVEFAFFDTLTGTELCQRVNPEMPIPPGATEVHGITDADVADKPTFRHYAPLIQQLVDDAILCGYSCRRYDTVLLHNELLRAEQKGLPMDSVGRIVVPEIDLFELWLRHENRKLTTAAKRFAGIELGDNAHSADADTQVLPEVLRGMCEAFGIDRNNVDQLCALSIPEGAIDRDGKFLKREDGTIVFNFGKSRGEPALEDLGLLEWVMRQPFMTPETKQVARALHNHAMKRSA